MKRNRIVKTWASSLAFIVMATLSLPATGVSTIGETTSVDLSPTPSAHTGPTIIVPASGDFQTALNSASPGDVIELEAGATFTGNFTLPNKTGGKSEQWITIRSSIADSNLPPEGTRITPSYAGVMPKLVSPNFEAALSTEPGAHHFRFIGVEFTIASDVMVNYGIVRLGKGTETDISMLPHDLIIDRCYVHGHAIADVQRGIALNGASTDIIDSYISDCHGIGFDTQAICGWNGPGPFKIVNNYLEASGENVMFGGADPRIPGLVPSDIEFRRNHCSKPLSWKDGILARPAGLAAVQESKVGGSLGAGATYYYRVTGLGPAGYDTTAITPASDEVSITIAAGQNILHLTWNPVAYANQYRIYRTTDNPASSERHWVYYTATIPAFTDVGDASSVGTDSTPPNVGTRWTVKNLFELKNAQRVLIEGNVFENNWLDAQVGYAILLKSQNQDGGAPWAVCQDVDFINNIVRHTASAINILGHDPYQMSAQGRRIRIKNNLFQDVDGARWGGSGIFLTISDMWDVVVDHNTVIHTGSVIITYGAPSTGFVFTNNVMSHNEYGVKGDDAGIGLDTLDKYFPGRVFKKNIIAGSDATNYPRKKNFYPASLNDVGFVDRANGNYRLADTSPYKRAGTKDKDIGADIDAIEKATGITITASHQNITLKH